MAIEDEAIAAEVERMLTTAIQRIELFIHHSAEQTVHMRGRDWLATLDVEPYSGGGYRVFGVKSVSRKPTGTANGAPQMPQGESEGEDPSGPKARAAAEAIAALWPSGIPKSLLAKERVNQIVAWCEGQGRSVPSERTIQNVVRVGT